MILALLILVFVFPMMIPQYKAAGIIFSTTMGMNYTVAVIVFGIIVALYTALGGYLAVVWSDALQSALMFVGVLIALFAAMFSFGGVSTLSQKLLEIDPALVSWTGPGGYWGPTVVIGMFLSYGLGCGLVPHAAVRFITFQRSGFNIKRMLITCMIVLPAWTLTQMVGLYTIVAKPGLKDADMAVPLLALDLLPPVIAGLIMACLLAAIMSTTDSIVLLAASAVCRDLYQRFARSEVSERTILMVSRVISLIIGIGGMLLALRPPALLTPVIMLAFSGLGLAMFFSAFLGLYWRRMNREGAIVGLLIPPIALGVLMAVFKMAVLPATLYAFIISAIVVFPVVWATPPPAPELVHRFFGNTSEKARRACSSA